MTINDVVFGWRDEISDAEVSALHAAAFDHELDLEPWSARLAKHSLGWVTARHRQVLIGFVNVVGDGGRHAFLVDTAVAPAMQDRGIGRALVDLAIRECGSTQAEWLHVDFEPRLETFYVRPGGFASTLAGLVRVAR